MRKGLEPVLRKWAIFMAAAVVTSLLAASSEAQAHAEPAKQDVAVEDKALAGAGTRAYDPEKAFFGPLPRYATKDGNLSVGAGLMLDFDAGYYGKSGTRRGTTIDSLEDSAGHPLARRFGIAPRPPS